MLYEGLLIRVSPPAGDFEHVPVPGVGHQEERGVGDIFWGCPFLLAGRQRVPRRVAQVVSRWPPGRNCHISLSVVAGADRVHPLLAKTRPQRPGVSA